MLNIFVESKKKRDIFCNFISVHRNRMKSLLLLCSIFLRWHEEKPLMKLPKHLIVFIQFCTYQTFCFRVNIGNKFSNANIRHEFIEPSVIAIKFIVHLASSALAPFSSILITMWVTNYHDIMHRRTNTN